jgi:hypothetical protein
MLMSKELNFNKADIDRENMEFYKWQEQIKTRDYRTWYGYLMKGGLNTYVGLRTGKTEYLFTFEYMTMEEARRHLKFKHLRTNLDDGLTIFDKAMLKDCRRSAENGWKKDCGLGYQVKEQGR